MTEITVSDVALCSSRSWSATSAPGRYFRGYCQCGECHRLQVGKAGGKLDSKFRPMHSGMRRLTAPRKNRPLCRRRGSNLDAQRFIKPDSVISDVLGASGRAMIEALIAREQSPSKLARLANLISWACICPR